jgi:rod shape-determining protein MreC
MSNIIAFFAKYHRFLLFVLLEAICLVFVVNYNRYQSAAFFNLTYEASGKVYALYDNVNYYFHLKQVNDSLMAENARLRAVQPFSKYIDTTKSIAVTDTIYKQKFVYLPGRVINNSISQRNNYLTLDIGSHHGVDKLMGVVTTAGVVGITTSNVSSNFTAVLSILHEDFSISAQIAETGSIGDVSWDGKNPDYVMLTGIPIQAQIKKGQVINTSPYSSIFPQGTNIGLIHDFEVKTGESNYTIRVKLAADLRNVRQVYVIDNLMKEEQQKVEAIEKDQTK